ncbi:MAG TPA: biopolymer transporter ExbD [Verrucomicrobiae bacterium]|nr:biopolymer transporter ExbD [Verrucomicrobiae bacterium]
MKKFSQTSHHALAELNITPLLDLAFVLLVIFIITTTPIVNDLDVDLPSAARRMKEQKAKENYITIESSGRIFLNHDVVDLGSLQARVAALRTDNPDLNIVIRGSAKTKYHWIADVMSMLQQANVGKVNLATDPFPDGMAMKK